MKDEKKAPKLRFKGFTDDWEQCKVKDIFKITRGKVLAATEISEEKSDISPFPVYSSQTKNNGLMGYYKDYLFDTAITWTTDGANAGTVSYRSGRFYSTNVNGVLISDKGYANKAISEILNLEAWKWVSHVGNPKLMNNVMGDISIMIPSSFEEQDRLSDFLNQLDDTITLHEEKKHQLERLKSALLQKMFADKSGYPDIRFEGFSDEWEQCKLGDVAKINSGKDYKGLQPGKIPVYGTGGYMLSVNDKLSDIDAIGIGRKGTIDKPYYLNAPFWTVDTLFYVTPRGTVDISFMFPLFKNINWKRYDESTGVPSLSKNTIKKIRVSFPQNNEQVKIGDLFQKITQIITLHDQKLNLLKLVKQSLLQKMFI
ncbi:restriction endonuclease subunit S [Lactobacillus delbrueckii]|uniref:restriction endonuclease subunit S n=1 Tax=Lactobacillus delbrueckii TaxID=1584 RepID=UPI0007395A56|nr:restriction endonuclease subunit S [Lactobacillus delbrueckii]CUS17080.1 Restriction endonuclease S subunits [Lactobacillus delbrueckii subsp. bulgaricus]